MRMRLLPVSRIKLIQKDKRVMQWDGILIILQAFICLVMFLFLPEASDPIRQLIVAIMFTIACLFGWGFYFTRLRENRSIHYLPYIILPIFILIAMYALPSVSFYFPFLFFITSTAYAMQWGGDRINLYYALASAALLIYCVFFTGLALPLATIVATSMIISLIFIGNHHVLFAREVYHQRNDRKKIVGLAQSLKQAKEESELILNTISDGVIVVDEEKTILVFNDGAASLLGWQQDELLGKNLSTLFDTSSLTLPHPSQAKVNQTIKVPQFKIMSKSGTPRFFNLILKSLTINRDDKYINATILVLHDVTSEEELEHMKIDFVAIAAHELRTPLTAIRGYLSILRNELATTITEEYQHFLNRAFSSTERLQALTENLLTVSKLERHVMHIRVEAVDWINFVRGRIDELTTLADEKGIDLSLTPTKNPIPAIEVDPMLMGEVINNLVANALTYTSKGKVSVVIEFNELEQQVTTHVIDTGQGIPAESIPHLFQKFYRVSGILEQGSKGTGLGLFISKAIIDRHQGKIWVESEIDKGSTFSFTLPVKQSGQPPSA